MATTSAPEAQASNPFGGLIDQQIAIIPSFTLESGARLTNVPVAYKTWGKLNERGDNVLIICHALTGSADVEDWWGPLLGPDRAFDPTRFFIFCGNVIGSPYGTVSSVTTNPETGKPYGPEMPGSSPKDDVRLHYQILSQLGVISVAAVVGGSMGGMTTLEWPLNSPPGFVRHIIPLATSARHSAWCISWGEAQRQSIYSDPDYGDGYYYISPDGSVDLSQQPLRGLGAARMAALLTYRSRDSFESRFGRRSGLTNKVPKGGVRIMGGRETTDPLDPGEADLVTKSPRQTAWREHNDGHRGSRRRGSETSSLAGSERGGGGGGAGGSNRGHGGGGESEQGDAEVEPVAGGSSTGSTGAGAGAGAVAPLNEGGKLGTGGERPAPKVFSAQSYLRYQGDKFTGRFDANCYIHITRKCDAHDISHPSIHPSTTSSSLPPLPADDLDLKPLHHALSLLPPALVIGIESDGLFTTTEQKELAAHIPDSELVLIPSQDGHDGFLLEFEAINEWVDGWFKRKIPEYYTAEGRVVSLEDYGKGKDGGWGVKKESVFGEAEGADVTAW